MSKSKSDAGKSERLRVVLEREIRSQANKRFLNGLPAFKPDHVLPERFMNLLADLDRAQAQSSKA